MHFFFTVPIPEPRMGFRRPLQKRARRLARPRSPFRWWWRCPGTLFDWRSAAPFRCTMTGAPLFPASSPKTSSAASNGSYPTALVAPAFTWVLRAKTNQINKNKIESTYPKPVENSDRSPVAAFPSAPWSSGLCLQHVKFRLSPPFLPCRLGDHHPRLSSIDARKKHLNCVFKMSLWNEDLLLVAKGCCHLEYRLKLEMIIIFCEHLLNSGFAISTWLQNMHHFATTF